MYTNKHNQLICCEAFNSMPLPWKKTKVATISRFVADLHSPKHGGSLVVQTGFPTSLVDLFVKNRDRLKKKKGVNTTEIETSREDDSVSEVSIGTCRPSVGESELGVDEFEASAEICEESEEIQVVEVEEQVRIKDVLIDSYNDDRISSKSSKFKLKLRRLVPKKLKESKKKKNKLMKNEVEMETELKNKLGRLIEQEQDQDHENDFDKEEEERVSSDSVIASQNQFQEIKQENQFRKIKQESYGYLILILIVLVGLTWGRIPALLLLLLWFLMLKFIGYHHSSKYLLL